MNGIIYYTKIKDEYDNKNMEHMIGEKLLEIGLENLAGNLPLNPVQKGSMGNRFLPCFPEFIIISPIPENM